MTRRGWLVAILFGLAIGGCGNVLACPASGCQTSGKLLASGGSYGFDWVVDEGYTQTLIPGVPLKLQARFVWESAGVISDHAIVAFVQGENPHFSNAPTHAVSRFLWTYGAGAFVGADGLNLELWFNPTAAFHGSAYVWNHVDRCGAGVNADSANACIAESAGAPQGWLSNLPGDWTMLPNQAYWVRVQIVSDDNGWSSMDGELIEESPSGLQVIQTGRMGFPTAAFFPGGNTVDGVVARSPGSGADIAFMAFDYGF